MTEQTASPPAEGELFPIGHYLGPFHPAPGAPPEYHVVRVGWDAPKISDGRQLDVWALSHGLPSRLDGPWTRASVRQAAAESGVADPDAALDALHESGLVVEVAPGTPAAVAFAQSHRVQALLVGLGNAPDASVRDGIGLIGLPPIVQVEPEVFEFWQLAQLWPSLWDAAEAFASVSRDNGDERPGRTDPHGVLDFFFVALRPLIASNAVYLDVVV